MNPINEVGVKSVAEAKRKLLELYARGGRAAGPVATKISRRPAGAPAPLSLIQEELRAQEQMVRGSVPYNESVTIQTNGWVDATVLKKALDEVIRRHEIWRTTFDTIDGEAVQVVHSAPLEFPWQVLDLRGLTKSDRAAELARITSAVAQQPFDFRNGPLLQAMLVRLTDTDQRLFLFAHLSILDGVSVYQILPRELATFYKAFSSGKTASLPDLPIQYSDYAYWQHQWMKSEQPASLLRCWGEKLGGNIPDLNWPNTSGSAAKNHRGAMQRFALGLPLTEALNQLVQTYGVTLFTALVTSFSALLHGYTGQVEMLIGTPSCGGRKRTEVQELLGNFLSPVALRINLEGNPSFRDVLFRVQQVIAEAVSNDGLPIEFLAKELTGQARGNAGSVSTAISLQPQSPSVNTGWQVSSMDVDTGSTAWDVYVAFLCTTGGIAGRVQYNCTRFNSQTILQTLCDLEQLMKSATDNPERTLSELGHSLGAKSVSAAV